MLCRDCCIRYVEAKVSKRLEANKLRAAFRDTPKSLLLPISLGSSSVSLLHITDQYLQYYKSRTGRSPFTIEVLLIDQSAVTEQSNYDEAWRTLKERFPCHSYSTAQLEDVFDYEKNPSFGVTELRIPRAEDNSLSKRNLLEVFLAGLPSATSRADIIGILRSRLVDALAKKKSSDSIIYGDSTTRLAERTLSETAKGRGGALPWLTMDGQSPDSAKTVYPMRDLLRKEITAYTTMTTPPLSNLLMELDRATTASASSKDTTIEKLMSQYFASVEQNYPSIVANVVRTSSRLVAPCIEAGEGRLCRMCSLPLAEGSQGLRWSGEQECLDGLVVSEESKDLASLCYGCARSTTIS
ncbi:MAG: hypothetical protein Q9170_006125 [Blastenia crenularia]